MWCGPRSLSTSTMYSFAQRSDTFAVDEPLYASYLVRHPHISRPYKDQLLKIQKNDGNMVLHELAHFPSPKPVVFAKHMAKHLTGLDLSLIFGENIVNIFLIRDPLSMILSWGEKGSVHQETCSLNTMGLPTLVQIFSDVRQHTKNLPIVIDSDMLRQSPREVLSLLCARIGIPFQEEMLKWPSGPKTVDG
jgi:protein-lysine N-methyltransferase EEF2KMT